MPPSGLFDSCTICMVSSKLCADLGRMVMEAVVWPLERRRPRVTAVVVVVGAEDDILCGRGANTE